MAQYTPHNSDQAIRSQTMPGLSDTHTRDVRDHINRRLEALRQERSSYLEHWRELSAYILPRRGRFLADDRNRGGSRSDKIIDNTATISARTLGSGMMAGITSPARQWFRLNTDNPKLMEDKAVKDWLYDVESIMRDTFARSNLYACLQNLYEELAVFGTGAMIIQADPNTVIRCRTFTSGEFLVAQDDLQMVDTLYREFSMTVGQLVTAFGRQALSEASLAKLDNNELDAWVEVVHAIEPNPKARSGSKAVHHMPYRSVYFEKSAASDKVLRLSGFEQFPAVVARWSVTGADVYGRGPGMDALPDVKQLQHEQLRKAQGIDKMVNPPMVAPAHMKGEGATVLPGGVTYVDVQQGQQSFQPAYRVDPRLNELTVDISETQKRINRAFYADLFLMLNEMDNAKMTAHEIDARREEKLLMLGPVLERLHDELLTPLVDRTFRLLVKAEALPPAPNALSGQSLHVSYISLLDRAQQAQSLAGMERLINVIGMLAPSNPELMQMIDGPRVLRQYAEQLGIPPSVLKSEEQIAAEKAEAAQQAGQVGGPQGSVMPGMPSMSGMPGTPGQSGTPAAPGAQDQGASPMAAMQGLMNNPVVQDIVQNPQMLQQTLNSLPPEMAEQVSHVLPGLLGENS